MKKAIRRSLTPGDRHIFRTTLYEDTYPGDAPEVGDYPVKGNAELPEHMRRHPYSAERERAIRANQPPPPTARRSVGPPGQAPAPAHTQGPIEPPAGPSSPPSRLPSGQSATYPARPTPSLSHPLPPTPSPAPPSTRAPPPLDTRQDPTAASDPRAGAMDRGVRRSRAPAHSESLSPVSPIGGTFDSRVLRRSSVQQQDGFPLSPTGASNVYMSDGSGSSQSTRSSSHVDLLVAAKQAQLPSASYRRPSLSGSRTYSEDVADRNIQAVRPADLASPEHSYPSHAYGGPKQRDYGEDVADRNITEAHATSKQPRPNAYAPTTTVRAVEDHERAQQPPATRSSPTASVPPVENRERAQQSREQTRSPTAAVRGADDHHRTSSLARKKVGSLRSSGQQQPSPSQPLSEGSDNYGLHPVRERDAAEIPSLDGVVDLTDTTDTEVITRQAPAVTHETVIPEVHHIREEIITREIHTHDVRHRIQPVVDVQVLPPRHFVPVRGGLKEISADEVPGRQSHWQIVETVTPEHGAPRQATPPIDEPVMESHEEVTTSEGHPRTETVWRHPSALETGARETGQSWPLRMDSPPTERFANAPAKPLQPQQVAGKDTAPAPVPERKQVPRTPIGKTVQPTPVESHVAAPPPPVRNPDHQAPPSKQPIRPGPFDRQDSLAVPPLKIRQERDLAEDASPAAVDPATDGPLGTTENPGRDPLPRSPLRKALPDRTRHVGVTPAADARDLGPNARQVSPPHQDASWGAGLAPAPRDDDSSTIRPSEASANDISDLEVPLPGSDIGSSSHIVGGDMPRRSLDRERPSPPTSRQPAARSRDGRPMSRDYSRMNQPPKDYYPVVAGPALQEAQDQAGEDSAERDRDSEDPPRNPNPPGEGSSREAPESEPVSALPDSPTSASEYGGGSPPARGTGHIDRHASLPISEPTPSEQSGASLHNPAHETDDNQGMIPVDLSTVGGLRQGDLDGLMPIDHAEAEEGDSFKTLRGTHPGKIDHGRPRMRDFAKDYIRSIAGTSEDSPGARTVPGGFPGAKADPALSPL
ncbi:MAG: hypothetical protein M1832_005498 [Thelocarpon impressellum]|nr:MAG: hypothetical protein M1832_005498 [Thelocarpon impressellum]